LDDGVGGARQGERGGSRCTVVGQALVINVDLSRIFRREQDATKCNVMGSVDSSENLPRSF